MKYKIFKTIEYQKWIDGQTGHLCVQIANRLSKIQDDGHFGIHKYLEDSVWELKWLSGLRIYYAHIPEKNILVLLGGNKNGQNKDIAKAKKIITKYT